MVQAVQATSLPIALIKVENQEAALLILETLISEVVVFLNVGKTMNETQIKITATMLLEDLEAKNMKPEDYRVMFNNAKKGLYGKQYDRLDGQIIFEWVRLYWNERAALVEEQSYKQHLLHKQKPDLKDVNPDGQAKIIEIFKNATAHIDDKKIETEDFIYPEPPQVDERTAFIQTCFRQFDELWQQYSIHTTPGPVRQINYNGHVVDQIEFTELKLKEREL